MRLLRGTQPFASNPLIDRALVKPFDPIAHPVATARSAGQGRPDASRRHYARIALHEAGSRLGRRSLALDGSEHGGRLPVRRDGGAWAVVCRTVTMLYACAMLALSAPAACAEPPSHTERAARSNSNISSANPWSPHISDAAKRFAIPERWIRAVMHVESVGDVHAVSRKGAMGLMQIMPATWEELRAKHRLGDDPFDPHDNILAGAAYLREMLDRFGRNGFLAAYNAGPRRYAEHLSTGRPLPPETIDYARKLSSLIGGTAPVPLPARKANDRSSALESSVFARIVSTRNDGMSPIEGKADATIETVFTAIRSPGVGSSMGGAVVDLTALVPQPDGLPRKAISESKPAPRGLFVQRSSATSE